MNGSSTGTGRSGDLRSGEIVDSNACRTVRRCPRAVKRARHNNYRIKKQFDRGIEQPIAGSIPVPASAELVITEGNNLLFDGEWAQAREFFAETWYVEVDDEERLRRLVARHVEFGKPADAAREWAIRVDQRNADLVASCRHRADLVVHPTRGQTVRPPRPMTAAPLEWAAHEIPWRTR